MNKDTILATIIGLILGLTITALFLFGPNVLKLIPHLTLPKLSFNTTKQPTQTTVTPTPTTGSVKLSIRSPLPESIETNDQLVVSGVTSPNTTIVVTSPLDDDVTVSNAEGTYAGKVTLTEGKNIISVTSYTDNKPTTVTVSVYYTQETL